jgi:hypothetical protein
MLLNKNEKGESKRKNVSPILILWWRRKGTTMMWMELQRCEIRDVCSWSYPMRELSGAFMSFIIISHFIRGTIVMIESNHTDIIGVNIQLPSEIVSFINYLLRLTKLQLLSWNCTTLINLPIPSNYSVSQHHVL